MGKTTSSTPEIFDQEKADRAVAFFERYLVHVKGRWAGQPLELLPWQAEVTRKIFGTLREDGSRRYRTVYVEVPKKNGKSTWASGIALLLLTADSEPGAEVYSCAADTQQAGIVFGIAKKMVEESPELSRRVKVYRYTLEVAATGSVYRVLSADAKTKHGVNAHGVIFDELHAQPNRDLWDAMDGAGVARSQPLNVAMTTAGWDRHSICWEVHEYARQVAEGVVEDESFLPVVYGAEEGSDWQDPEVWRASNPSLGSTFDEEDIASKCAKAVVVPGYVNTFRRLHLNQWTESASRWLSIESWDRCDQPVLAEEGEECYAGLDLASKIDLTALVLYFRASHSILAWFWTPAETIAERSRRDRVPYEQWCDEGWMEATEGNRIDHDLIEQRILEIGSRYQIRELAYDPWNTGSLITHLQDRAVSVVPMYQDFKNLSPGSKELESLVVDEKIRHGGNPVLRWMASHVAVQIDANENMKPDKKKSAERIDGMTALVMAMGRAILRPEVVESVYESRGLVTL